MRSLPVAPFMSLALLSLLVSPVQAQSITSDGSLGTTIGTIDNRNFLITGGRTSGSNLFHSFGNFSVPTGGSATFNLLGTPGVSTIFGRVTGGNPSNIDGRIIAPANLFLLNPNGVVFGANAQLLVSGSFVGTTASSIRFADGFEFAATNNTPPLLTMSAPIGLQFGQNAGAIRVQGNGHNLTSQNPLLYPYLPASFSLAGLRVSPGRTLALVGGDVTMDGGIVAAPGGRVEIGSVGSGQVGIRSTTQGFALDYSGVSALQNIQMSQRSLLDVGWLLDQTRSAGSIQVQGNNIRLSEGSLLLSQNRGLQAAGELTVRATGLLELLGTNATETISSGIVSETSGLGSNSNLNVIAQGLKLQNGGIIQSRTYSPAPGGSISVTVADWIQMSGTSSKTNTFNVIGATSFFSSLSISPLAPPVTTGKAGSITVSTRQLSLRDGSTVASLSFGDASAGNLVVNTDATELIGRTENVPEPIGSMPTSLLSISYRRGNSAAIALNTRTLDMRSGGTISTTNLGAGNSGSVTINASESIEMSSDFLKDGWFSNISSTLGSGDYNLQILDPRKLVNGNAGDVTINTPSLQVNQAGISVGNYGIGAAGTLKINADSVRLSNGGGIAATTFSGEGGNIDLKAQTLVLRNFSAITTNASGSGNGGNITIAAPFIVGLGNSDIFANAELGRGGNIQITTQGIFGLAFRDLLDPRAVSTNDITASSRASANGTVQITTPGVDPNSGLVELPGDLIDSSQRIAQGCLANQESSFVMTGRGGIPVNPMEQVQRDRTWSDLRDLSAFQTKGDAIAQPVAQPELVEATNWYRSSDGKVQIVAPQVASAQLAATCVVSK